MLAWTSPTREHKNATNGARPWRGLALLALLLLPGAMAPAAVALPDALPGVGFPDVELPVPLPVKCVDLLLNTGTTGWDANAPYAINAPGVAESKWILTNAPVGGQGPAVAVAGYPGWMPNNGWEMWISPTIDATNQNAASAPPGTYTYDFKFYVSKECRERATLRLCFAADNAVTVSLNGATLGSSSTFKGWTCAYVANTGPWLVGGNLLRATVTNYGGPTGYIAQGTLFV